MENFRSGIVVILGPTNAGKSTLLNALMGQKISIVSKKPQTTYHGIRGIQTHETYQIIYTDTPGLQRYPQTIPRLLNRVAESHRDGCDAAIWVFDVSKLNPMKEIEGFRKRIEKEIPRERRVCVLNKIDRVHKEKLLPLIAQVNELGLFAEIFPLSATKGANVDELKKVLVGWLPEGPHLYDPGTQTDRAFAFRASELIREKIYRWTHEEVPYAVYVDVEEHQDTESKTPTIFASVCVDSESKKGILIGKSADRLKQIGIEARRDIEKVMGQKICLKLHVKVDPHWTSDSHKIQKYLELS